MRISVLCSDPTHPVNAWLERWVEYQGTEHEVTLLRRNQDLPGGDMLFLVSCAKIVKAADRSAYQYCLVLHASDLPRGRGWSPHIWAIVSGADLITLSLLEAEDKVDTGRIWHQVEIKIPKHALWNEVNDLIFGAELWLMDFAVENAGRVEPMPQAIDVKPSYFPRRTIQDSRIDAERSITDQFDLLRVCDPHRFPAWFEMRGHRYKIALEKFDE